MYPDNINKSAYFSSPSSTKKDRIEIFDYTDRFLRILKANSSRAGFGGIFWTLGTFGAGKSAYMCILNNILLTSAMDKREAFLYKAPDKLLDDIQEAIKQKELREKFQIIDNLDEVKSFGIFNLDEGYLTANAKRALHKDSVNFEDSITTLRHNHIFTILNSADDGILKGYRTKAQFKCYKLISDGYIEENTKDKFARTYHDILTTLAPQETLFKLTHATFLKDNIRRGYLYLDLKDYCPWYNDEISKSFEGESFNARLRRLKQEREKMEKVITLIIDNFETLIIKKPTKVLKVVRGFLFDEHIDLFERFEDQISRIIDVAIYRLYRKEETLAAHNKSVKKEEETIKKEIILPDTSDDIEKYFFNYYSQNGVNNLISTILSQWIIGLSQRDLAHNNDSNLTYVNGLLQDYREGSNLSDDLLRLAYCYEFWIAKKTNGIRNGARSEPDILYYDENEKIIGPGECKLIDDTCKSLTFYLELPKDSNKTLKPSYIYCKKHNLRYFPLFLRNPKWKYKYHVYDLLIPIDIEGDNKITVFKSNYKQYLFNEFNANQFFRGNTQNEEK